MTKFSLDDATLDEQVEMEDALGLPMLQAIDTAKGRRMLAMFALRRTNPAATLEDAGKLTGDEFARIMGFIDAEEPVQVPPPVAAAEGSGSPGSAAPTESTPGTSGA